jgi:thiol:disulfide interchange protein DsbA
LEPELVASDPDGAPTTGRFELGAHYLRLSPTQPTSSSPEKVEVAEVFWYGCPHCFAFEPLLAQWLERRPDYVSFVRVPAVWNPLLQLHARAFYSAEALGKGGEMHTEFFREIHERGNRLDSEARLQEFFGRFGVEAAAFKTAFDSFAVQEKLQRADELSRRYRIGSVPTVIVNGKYTTDAPQTGGYEELLALVDELVVAENAGR